MRIVLVCAKLLVLFCFMPQSKSERHMIILPSIVFATTAAFMTLRGNRKLAIASWVVAVICMLGAMQYHMDDVMTISL